MTSRLSLCLLLTLNNVNAWMAVNSPQFLCPGGGSLRVSSRSMKSGDDEMEQDLYIRNQIDYFETQFSSRMSIIHDWTTYMEEPCGEDCEQCDIPDEIKSSNEKVDFDVMAYLGIKRAEPIMRPTDGVDRLRVEHENIHYSDSEWQ